VANVSWSHAQPTDTSLFRKPLGIQLSAPINSIVRELDSQVVEVWFEPDLAPDTGAAGPAPIFVIHGATTFPRPDLIEWLLSDSLDSVLRLLVAGGRVLIRIHVGHMLDDRMRPFSADPRALLRRSVPPFTGSTLESWVFLRGNRDVAAPTPATAAPKRRSSSTKNTSR
jgi:hypothetical protein